MPSAIPIQNLYYLYCYAWNRFPEGKSVDVGTTDSPDLLNLLARVLLNAVDHLRRRGLDRGYVSIAEDSSYVRGRIVLNETLRRDLLPQGRVHVIYDELSHDIPANRIIKATLRSLATANTLVEDLADRLRGAWRAFNLVSDIRLSRASFRRVTLNRNNAYYDLALKICALVHDCTLPEEDGGSAKFADILEDKDRMSALFEEFILTFYRLEQEHFQATSEWISWDSDLLSGLEAALLPQMRTDVTLRSPHRTIVVETKFYKGGPLVEHHEKDRLHSNNLYQLFAYLKNLERSDGPDEQAEGILLYASVGQDLSLRYMLGGHRVAVRTIDLNRPWRAIHDDLLALIA